MPDEEQITEVVDPDELEVVTDDDPPADDPPTDEELSDAEKKEAHGLYKLLRDPSQQKNVVRILAQQSGLLNANGEPTGKQTVAATRRDLKELVKEKLGPEYAFFSDKLTEVIGAALAEERSYIDERLTTSAQNEVERETFTALDRLARETKGESKKFEDRMISLMDRIKPSENLSTYEYFKDLYTLASSGKVAASTKAQIADKINRNAGNAAERLNSKGTGKGGTPTGPEKKGLKASVEYALKQMGLNK